MSSERRHGVLNNEFYIGWLVWSRYRGMKDPETDVWVTRLNPTEKWITVVVSTLRSVDNVLKPAAVTTLCFPAPPAESSKSLVPRRCRGSQHSM